MEKSNRFLIDPNDSDRLLGEDEFATDIGRLFVLVLADAAGWCIFRNDLQEKRAFLVRTISPVSLTGG